MSEKRHYVWFLVIAVSILLTVNIFTPNPQNNQMISNNSPDKLTNEAIAVNNPSDLQLLNTDKSNHTIPWTLSNNLLKDYAGLYSFTDDPVGSNPAGLMTFESGITHVDVINASDDHNKVLELWDNSATGYAYIAKSIPNVVKGTVEFWHRYSEAGSYNCLYVAFNKEGSTWPFGITFWDTWVNIQGGTNIRIGTYSENIWRHIRIDFDCTSDKLTVYIDGINEGTFNFATAITNVYNLTFSTSSSDTSSNTYHWLDAIDFSWAPGYYLNRNMDTAPSSKDYCGLYSFTTDAVGSQPAGWTCTVPAGDNIQTVAGMSGHNKVVFINSTNTSEIIFRNSFSAKTTGTIAFWLFTNSSTACVYMRVEGTGGMVFGLATLATFKWCDMGSWYDLIPNINVEPKKWYYIQMAFSDASQTVQLYINDTFIVGQTHDTTALRYTYHGANYAPNELQFRAYGLNLYFYVDAVDYSWAPGYYINRFRDFTPNPKDYCGLYSFSSDTALSIPAGWTRPFQNLNTLGYVINEKAGHRKVIQMYDNSPTGYTILHQSFSAAQTSGTVEFWFYGNKTGPLSSHQFEIGNSGNGVYLLMNTSKAELLYYDTSWHKICNLPNEVWHHIQVTFDCGTDKFNITVDQRTVAYGCSFNIAQTSLTWIELYTGGGSSGGFYVYFDAFDYSWAPGYYNHRNLDYNMTVIDYPGMYSFANDANSTVPFGWSYSSSGNTYGKVIDEKAGHQKVLETYDNVNGGSTILEQDFGNRTAGTVELWYYGVTGTGTSCNLQLCIHNYWGISGVYLLLNFSYANIGYIDTRFHKICDMPNNQWHHLRIVFNCGSDTFALWVDGIQRVTNAPFQNPQANLTKVVIYTGSGATGGYYCYFDAFDYSWAPSYYPYRNLKSFYAIYENGAQKTLWIPWLYQTRVNYNVNATKLGLGSHNISLVFNDGYGNWAHDDVRVNVLAIPNIRKVDQSPLQPISPEIVNITVRITDDTQVQTALIESNHTGALTNYTMSLLSGTGSDGIWNFTMKGYAVNKMISYKIYALDNYNYVNSSKSYGFSASTLPNVEQVTCISPTYYQAPVIITAHITDAIGVQTVYIEANCSRSSGFQNDTISWGGNGTLQDGIWNYTILNYDTNITIWYRIIVQNTRNNWVSTNYYNVSYFDTAGPDILGLTQTNVTATYPIIVNVTAQITDKTPIRWVLIEANPLGTLSNSSMTSSSGGIWYFTFNNYDENRTISYRIYACDILGNIKSTSQYNFGYFDTLGPNILSVLQEPTVAGYNPIVNITVHITDYSQIMGVEIETNLTGTLERVLMTPAGGNLQDGIWTYSFTEYLADVTVTYQIFVRDVLGNLNSTDQYILSYPNIISVLQSPSGSLEYQEPVNVSVHIRDRIQISVVAIKVNCTGIPVTYNMTWVGGSLYDGIWNYTLKNYPENRTITYQIFVQDAAGHLNQSSQFSFGYFDMDAPRIVSIVQIPPDPAYLERVNVTVHITDDTLILAVEIETNYYINLTRIPMTLVNGTGQDGFWEFSFPSTPANRTVLYSIYVRDILGNQNQSSSKTFGFIDTLGPEIVSVVHTPFYPAYKENVTVIVHITEPTKIQAVEIETNWTAVFIRYPMTQVNGSLQDGFWKYIFTNYPANQTISYRIHALDTFENANQTGLYNFSYFDILGPNIASLVHLPSAPVYNQNVIVTVYLTDLSQIQVVEIETNYTFFFVRYPMTFVNGSFQNGFWEYTFTTYPANRTISYRVHVHDVFGNLNQTGLYNFSHFDTLGPNIVSVLQTPSIPAYQEAVNITVHITEPSQIQMVAIETNYTSALLSYPMMQISGDATDGIWRFTITNYPVNQTIIYRIHTKDILGNLNQTVDYSFSHFDTLGPNIMSVLQTPPVAAYQEVVNITVHITEPSQIQMVAIETNYTSALLSYPMTQISGDASDGIWSFIFSSYPVNQTIIFRIHTKDILGNLNQTVQYSFGYFDTLGPNIISVDRIPASPSYKESVSITVHIKDGTQIQAVQIETNFTSSLARYSMAQISGDSNDGVWEFTLNSYPINKLIIYSILTKDIFGNLNNTGQFGFGAFDTLNPSISSVIQSPTILTAKEFVNIKARVIENFELISVKIENNATGAWINQSMSAWSGSPPYQDSIWEFTFIDYNISQTIQYRIFATDISGRTGVTGFYRFGFFPIVKMNIPHYQQFIIYVDKNKECTITFQVQNTLGSYALTNLNFTIIAIPSGWTTPVRTQLNNRLDPGSSLYVELKVAASNEESAFQKNITIKFEATIEISNETYTDVGITVEIIGRMGKTTDWTIIIYIAIGAAAALGVSLVVIQRRRKISASPGRAKPQAVAALKTGISKDFPDSYTIIPLAVIERINNMKDLTVNERDLLIEFISQLEEDEAMKYLDALEEINPG